MDRTPHRTARIKLLIALVSVGTAILGVAGPILAATLT